MGGLDIDGTKLNYGIMLVIVILLFIFGSSNLQDLQSAPEGGSSV